MAFKHHQAAPALPHIDVDFDLQAPQLRALRKLTAEAHSCHNLFKADGEDGKYGPKRFRAVEILVRRAPIAGINPDLSDIDLLGQTCHVALTGMEDGMDERRHFPLRACAGLGKPERIQGAILRDRKGRHWLLDITEMGKRTQTDPPPVRRIANEISPVARFLTFDDSLVTPVYMRGPMTLDWNQLLSVDFSASGATKQRAPSDPYSNVLGKWVDERLAHEDLIEKALAGIVTDSACEAVLRADRDDPTLSPHGRSKARNCAVNTLARPMLEALRAAGACAPCPNSFTREIGEMDAWNAWLDGRFDAVAENDYDTRWFERDLERSTLHGTLGFLESSVTLDREKQIFERENPGEKFPYSSDREVTFTAQDFSEMASRLRQDLIEAVIEGGSVLHRAELISRQNGERHGFTGHFLRPVLCSFEESLARYPRPLTNLEANPPSLRHLEIPLPSGRLAMADWFRISGFTEAVEKICEDKNYEINYAIGVDARAKDYFEKMGIAIVQVGNTSPYAYQVQPGTWYMGHVHEDDDAYWNEAGESIRPIPKESWTTCTDLWANTFADVEAIADVLMASERYETRESAIEAIEAYCVEASGANIIEIDTPTLHLYMPTGYGGHVGNFDKVFDARGIDPLPASETHYVISTTPLDVDSDLFETHDWRAPETLRARRCDEPSLDM